MTVRHSKLPIALSTVLCLALVGCSPIGTASATLEPAPRTPRASLSGIDAKEAVKSSFSNARKAKSVKLKTDVSDGVKRVQAERRGRLDDTAFHSVSTSQAEGTMHVLVIQGSLWFKADDAAAVTALRLRSEQKGKWVTVPTTDDKSELQFGPRALMEHAITTFPIDRIQSSDLENNEVTHDGSQARKVREKGKSEKEFVIISTDGKNRLLAVGTAEGEVTFSDWDEVNDLEPPQAQDVVSW